MRGGVYTIQIELSRNVRLGWFLRSARLGLKFRPQQETPGIWTLTLSRICICFLCFIALPVLKAVLTVGFFYAVIACRLMEHSKPTCPRKPSRPDLLLDTQILAADPLLAPRSFPPPLRWTEKSTAAFASCPTRPPWKVWSKSEVPRADETSIACTHVAYQTNAQPPYLAMSVTHTQNGMNLRIFSYKGGCASPLTFLL